MSCDSPVIALVSRLTDPRKLDQLRAIAPEAGFRHFHDDRDGLATRGADAQIVYGNVRPHELSALTKLRWVHATWAGVENLLYPEMAASEVVITNCRGQSAVSMSEHALAGLLYLARDLPAHVAADRAGLWKRPVQPRHLAGSRALVLGAGAVGRVLIPKLHALEVEVVAVNTTGRPVDGAAKTMTLDGVADELSTIDHVIVLLPATPHTRHTVDAAFFGRLKPGATLVNISRGSIVDESALLEALDAGQVHGAVLDVTDPEPPADDHPLYGHPRALLTGHRSWMPTPDGVEAFGVFAHNLRCYVEGRADEMINVVDKPMGY